MVRSSFARRIVAIMIAAGTLAVSACNTIEGRAGRVPGRQRRLQRSAGLH